jgi:hypothetical protein
VPSELAPLDLADGCKTPLSLGPGRLEVLAFGGGKAALTFADDAKDEVGGGPSTHGKSARNQSLGGGIVSVGDLLPSEREELTHRDSA